MENHHLDKVTKASEMADVVPKRNGDSLSTGPFSSTHDLISFDDNDGAGVGHGHGNDNTTSTGNGKGVSNDQPTSNPFSDEAYYVAGPADVAAAVKMGYVSLFLLLLDPFNCCDLEAVVRTRSKV